MAERRMFSKKIIDTDVFLDLPATTQNLYFHLLLRADDDGFITSPKSILRAIRCSEEDLKMLIAKEFILAFQSGVIVLKHWRIHNSIQKDRYRETECPEKAELMLVGNTYEYIQDVSNLYPKCIQNVSNLETQDRIGKDRLDKDINKEKKVTGYKAILSEYTNNDELLDVLQGFIEMRKAKKKPNTDRAVRMFLNKLNELAKDDTAKIAIVNQSILHGWDSVYPLKDNIQKKVIKESNTWVNPQPTDEEFLNEIRRQCNRELGIDDG